MNATRGATAWVLYHLLMQSHMHWLHYHPLDAISTGLGAPILDAHFWSENGVSCPDERNKIGDSVLCYHPFDTTLLLFEDNVAKSVVGNSSLNLDESPTGLGNVILILMQFPPTRGALLFRQFVLLNDQRFTSPGNFPGLSWTFLDFPGLAIGSPGAVWRA